MLVTQLLTPWTVARKAPLSMKFSRQEYWAELPFSSPGDLPNPGIEPHFLHCKQILFRDTREVQISRVDTKPLHCLVKTLQFLRQEKDSQLKFAVGPALPFSLQLAFISGPLTIEFWGELITSNILLDTPQLACILLSPLGSCQPQTEVQAISDTLPTQAATTVPFLQLRCSLGCKSPLSLIADHCLQRPLLEPCCTAPPQSRWVLRELSACIRKPVVVEQLPSEIWATSDALLE